MAGGSGKRLWPLSTKEMPKQFISLFGDLSLFDLTLQRLNNRDLFKKPIIVTSEDYLTIGRLISDLNIPTLYVMEGGYAVEEIGVNTVNVLLGHLNR